MKSTVLTVCSTYAEQLWFLKIFLKSCKTVKNFFKEKQKIKIQK